MENQPSRWRVGEWLLELLMALVLLTMLLVGLVDVFGRYLFLKPLPGAAEIAELSLGLLVFGSLPLVTVRREHVTVELITPLLRGRLRRSVDSVVALLSAGLVALVALQLADQAVMLTSYGDRSVFLKVPLAPVAWFMGAMAAMTTLTLVWQGVAPWLPERRRVTG